MPIFAMKPRFKNGRVQKKTIIHFDAVDKDEAYRAFGAGHYWSGYSELISFHAEEIIEPTPDINPLIAADVIERHKDDYG